MEALGLTDTGFIALAAAALSAIASWIIARRRMSGTVATTDADRLWAQNEKLIDAYATDNRHLRERIQGQDDRLAKQDDKLWDLTKRERECIEQNTKLTRQVERMERMLKVDLRLNTEADLGHEFDEAAGGGS